MMRDIKRFVNIYGCINYRYPSYFRTGIGNILKTGYVRRISYTLKHTGLLILLRTLQYLIQKIGFYGEVESLCFW